jgi:hypothetical protein
MTLDDPKPPRPTDAVTLHYRESYNAEGEAAVGLARILGVSVGLIWQESLSRWFARSLRWFIPEWSATVDEVGLRITDPWSDPGPYYFRWGDLAVAFETRNLVCLVPKGRASRTFGLPKRAVTPSELETLRGLVSDHLPLTPDAIASLREEILR